MGHAGRMGNHGLDTAEALGKSAELNIVHQPLSRFSAAGQFESNHAAET